MLVLASDSDAIDWELTLPDESVVYGKQDSERTIHITDYITEYAHMAFDGEAYERDIDGRTPDIRIPANVKIKMGKFVYHSPVGHGLRCEVNTDLQSVGLILDGANVLLTEQFINCHRTLEEDKQLDFLVNQTESNERGREYLDVLREQVKKLQYDIR